MRASDHKREIVDYFKKNISKGYTADSLKWALVRQGYSRAIIEKAFEDANKEIAASAPVLKERPIIRHEVVDEEAIAEKIHRPFWKRLFGLD